MRPPRVRQCFTGRFLLARLLCPYLETNKEREGLLHVFMKSYLSCSWVPKGNSSTKEKATAPANTIQLHDKTHYNNKAMQRVKHTCFLTQLFWWTAALCVIATDVHFQVNLYHVFSASFVIPHSLNIKSTEAVQGSCNEIHLKEVLVRYRLQAKLCSHSICSVWIWTHSQM